MTNTNTIILNTYQQAVIDAAAIGPQVIEACPGSGKTATLESLVAALVQLDTDPLRIGIFTFSRSAASEMRWRIARTLYPDADQTTLDFFADPKGEHASAFSAQWVNAEPARAMLVNWTCTIHALSYRLLNAWYKSQGTRRPRVLSGKSTWEAKNIIKDGLDELDWKEGPKAIQHWISKAITNLIQPHQSTEWFRELLPADTIHRADDLAELYRRYYDFCKRQNLVDFDMMQARVVYLLRNDPAFKTWAASQFDYVLVDEAQDTSSQQAEILFALAQSRNVVFCGDVDQCIPEGQQVLTPNGWTAVENIQKYDKVISAVGGVQTKPQLVTQVSKQFDNRLIITLKTKSGCKLKVTGNHIVFASLPGMTQGTQHHTEKLYFVYLMYKRNRGFRVGISSMPKVRLLREHGDKLWLLKSMQGKDEALYWEALYAAKYGLPTMTFGVHVTGGNCMTKENIERLFLNLDTSQAAEHLAKGEHVDLVMPHVVAGSHSGVERMTLYYTICNYPPQPNKARGRKNAGHLISGESSNYELLSTLSTAGIKFTKARKGGWRFRQSSTNAKAMEEKAKAFAQILDTELIIRGRFGSGSKSSLMPRAMPACNVLPGFLVPVWSDGKIRLDEVTNVTKEYDTVAVYDLEVMNTANFIVGDPGGPFGNPVEGVVVHNSMYKFRGAEPAVLREDFEAVWSNVTRFNLPVNYRSTQAIVAKSAQLITANYTDDDNTYLKPFQHRPDALPGDPIAYIETPDVDALKSEVVNTIADSAPGDWFILSRTRAECATLHTALIAANIPAINKSGGLLFGSPHVKKVLAYARLACDYQSSRDDLEVLSEIANVATAAFRAPWTRRRHLDNCNNTKSWVNCGCPIIAEGDEDYSHSRFYGQKAIQSAGGWRGIVGQQFEKNRGGYATSRAKGAKDLVQFVNLLEARHSDDAAECLRVILNQCIIPWLASSEGLSDEDLAENGKTEDFDVLLNLVEPNMTTAEFLTRVDELASGCSGDDERESVILGTIHWSKGAERPRVIVNTTRLPITPPQRRKGQLPTGSPPSIEEERRLMFVAMTRAKHECVLMGSKKWNGMEVARSQFVSELDLQDGHKACQCCGLENQQLDDLGYCDDCNSKLDEQKESGRCGWCHRPVMQCIC